MLHALPVLHGWFIRAYEAVTRLFAFASAELAVLFAALALLFAAPAVELAALAVDFAWFAVVFAVWAELTARFEVWTARFAWPSAFLASFPAVDPSEGTAQARPKRMPMTSTRARSRFRFLRTPPSRWLQLT